MDIQDVRRSAPHPAAIVASLAPLATAKELELAVKLPEPPAARPLRRRSACGRS